jgi:hypothetical protein
LVRTTPSPAVATASGDTATATQIDDLIVGQAGSRSAASPDRTAKAPPGEAEGEIMPEREQGLRRVAAVTIGLMAAGVTGSLAVAAIAQADSPVAQADSHAATTGTSTSTSTESTGSGTSSSDTTGTGTTGSNTRSPDTGPALSPAHGAPHATSGGS